jgi:hypothetical protein
MADGTPRPAGWTGGNEHFGFLRTFDGHVATDRTGGSPDDTERFSYANVKWGFDDADISGDYGPDYDLHCDELGSA